MYLTNEYSEQPFLEFDLDGYDVIGTSKMNPSLPVYVITHGFMESGNKTWVNNYFYLYYQIF